ncbi:MAG TPA: YnbE family lipoprotein [Alphaproteobacteria bacterium]|nr:YnbE family lipoprotein [Alphaproteobacteria bacterium]
MRKLSTAAADDPGNRRRALIVGLAATGAVACSPTVRVEPPDRPIEINLNVRIEQEVRIRVDRDLEQVFEENEAIF